MEQMELKCANKSTLFSAQEMQEPVLCQSQMDIHKSVNDGCSAKTPEQRR